jgi:hypothetical protein
MKGALAGLAIFFSVICASSVAQAEGEDEITLKNGGSVRGTIVTVEPGESVKIIELGSQEPRVLRWDEVADVEKGKYARHEESAPPANTTARAPAQPAQRPPSRPVPAAPTGPTVHIDSPVPSTLMGSRGTIDGRASLFEPLCESPCDRPTGGSPSTEYYISGDFGKTPTFTLRDYGGTPTVVVTPVRRGQRAAGIALTVIGSVMTVVGTSLLLDQLAEHHSGDEVLFSGVIFTPAGVLTAVTGAILWGTSGTHVKVTAPGYETAVRLRPWAGGLGASPRARGPALDLVPSPGFDSAACGIQGSF